VGKQEGLSEVRTACRRQRILQHQIHFTNASLGWPAITSIDLPSGAPSPPLTAMGTRLLVNITDQLSVLGGSSTATRQALGRVTPKSATATASISASTIRPRFLGKSNTPGTTRRRSEPCRTNQVWGLAPFRLVCRSAAGIKRRVAGAADEPRYAPVAVR